MGQRVGQDDRGFQGQAQRPLQSVPRLRELVPSLDEGGAQIVPVDQRRERLELGPQPRSLSLPDLLEACGRQVQSRLPDLHQLLIEQDLEIGEPDGEGHLPPHVRLRRHRQVPRLGCRGEGRGERGVEEGLVQIEGECIVVRLAHRDLLGLTALIEEDRGALEIAGVVVREVERGERAAPRLLDRAAGLVDRRRRPNDLLALGERQIHRLVHRKCHLGRVLGGERRHEGRSRDADRDDERSTNPASRPDGSRAGPVWCHRVTPDNISGRTVARVADDARHTGPRGRFEGCVPVRRGTVRHPSPPVRQPGRETASCRKPHPPAARPARRGFARRMRWRALTRAVVGLLLLLLRRLTRRSSRRTGHRDWRPPGAEDGLSNGADRLPRVF